MYSIRKRDLKAFTPAPQSVCRIEDGSTNPYLRNERIVEEFLKRIEPQYNVALANLEADDIDAECVYVIAGFVAYVLVCSPAGMRIQSGPFKSVVSINRGIVRCAETMVFFRDNSPWIPGFVRKNAGFRIEPTTKSIAHGTGTMLWFTQEIRETRPAVNST